MYFFCHANDKNQKISFDLLAYFFYPTASTISIILFKNFKYIFQKKFVLF